MKCCYKCGSNRNVKEVTFTTGLEVKKAFNNVTVVTCEINLCLNCIFDLIIISDKWLHNNLKLCRCKHKEIEFKEVTEWPQNTHLK